MTLKAIKNRCPMSSWWKWQGSTTLSSKKPSSLCLFLRCKFLKLWMTRHQFKLLKSKIRSRTLMVNLSLWWCPKPNRSKRQFLKVIGLKSIWSSDRTRKESRSTPLLSKRRTDKTLMLSTTKFWLKESILLMLLWSKLWKERKLWERPSWWLRWSGFSSSHVMSKLSRTVSAF